MLDLGPFAVHGRFFKGNLHTHCTRSDGVLPVERVVQAYRDGGYDFLSMTDHFLEKYDFPVTDTRPFRDETFTTLLGAELHAPALENGEAWHLVANGLPLDFAPLQPGETGPELGARAVEAGAFLTLAHPAWYGQSVGDARAVPAAHAVEIYNHGCAVGSDRGGGAYILDALVGEGRRLTAVATDDAHFKEPDAFGGWVHVKAESLEPEHLLSALKAGHFYASQGPTIHDLAIDDEAIEVVCSPARSVVAVGHRSVSAHALGDGLTRVRLSRERLVKSPYIRITVTDRAGLRAWTNPIFPAL
ncbi:MAG: phosphotransferase [Geminicoccaceae bacterium]